MAFSVTALTGMPSNRVVDPNEIYWLPGDPGVAFVKDQRYAMSGGVLIAATDSLDAPFRCVRSVTCAAATTAFTRPSALFPANPTADTTLVPCKVDMVAGAPVAIGKLKNYQDETVVSYTASTRAIACTTGFGADDRPNGALIYVYEGVGIGEYNIVEDYDHTGGAAELLLICHRAFTATLDTTSKFVVLSSTAAANAVGMFGRMDVADTDELDCSDGADDGNYTACVSWDRLDDYLAIGHMPHIPSAAIWSE